MDKEIIIVEGPSGSGKSTYINNMVKPGYSAAVSTSFSSDRLPTDIVQSGFVALQNDTRKLFASISLFLMDLELSCVYIDRLVVSQLVYHELRTNCQNYRKKNIRFSIHEVKARLLGMCNYINFMLPNYLAAYVGIYPELNIAINIKLIVPDWEELQNRRASSTKEYPAGRRDHELYEYLYLSAGTDYIERVGSLVL